MRGVTRAFSSTEYTAVPFHPALPMREVIYIRFNESRIFLISTRTPHAGSDHMEQRLAFDGEISTRTPHAGSDSCLPRSSEPASYFNPHSPCGE